MQNNGNSNKKTTNLLAKLKESIPRISSGRQKMGDCCKYFKIFLSSYPMKEHLLVPR